MGAKQTRRKSKKAKIVEAAIEKYGKKLKEEGVQTLGDFIKLVQLQKDLDEDEPKEVKATWVDPSQTKSGTG